MTFSDTSAKLKRSLLRRIECHAAFLSALEAIVETRAYLNNAERAAIAAAREKGASWEDVADALGVSRQAVYQRYRHRNGNSPWADARATHV